jgi:hypothetical protein
MQSAPGSIRGGFFYLRLRCRRRWRWRRLDRRRRGLGRRRHGLHSWGGRLTGRWRRLGCRRCRLCCGRSGLGRRRCRLCRGRSRWSRFRRRRWRHHHNWPQRGCPTADGRCCNHEHEKANECRRDDAAEGSIVCRDTRHCLPPDTHTQNANHLDMHYRPFQLTFVDQTRRRPSSVTAPREFCSP